MNGGDGMYKKLIQNNYIVAVGTGDLGTDITSQEYNEILGIIRNRPAETETTGYHLKTDLTWESYEKAPQPDPSEEELEDSEAIEILLGGAS